MKPRKTHARLSHREATARELVKEAPIDPTHDPSAAHRPAILPRQAAIGERVLVSSTVTLEGQERLQLGGCLPIDGRLENIPLREPEPTDIPRGR